MLAQRVGTLQIAMHDAAGVRMSHRFGDLQTDPQDFLRGAGT